jgi:hypothetical protein
MSIYQCIKVDDRYIPPRETIVYESPTESEAIEWLQNNGGGIYRNILHHTNCPITAIPIK